MTRRREAACKKARGLGVRSELTLPAHVEDGVGIAAVYLAEFMRLYEHFRARAIAIEVGKDPARKLDLTLAPDGRWARKYYVEGSPECKAREAMA